MEPRVQDVLDRIEQEDTDQRAAIEQGATFEPTGYIQSLHPESTKLLHILIQAVRPTRLLEIGASRGYSTVTIADAARIVGGHLTSLELSGKSIGIATANLDEAGVADYVDFIEGDARETLDTLTGTFDFVFLDCWDRLYPEIFPKLLPLIKPGALIFSDNVTPGMTESDAFLEVLKSYQEIETVDVPIGRDVEVSIKKAVS